MLVAPTGKLQELHTALTRSRCRAAKGPVETRKGELGVKEKNLQISENRLCESIR